jgi:hypothetical protein
MLILRDRIPEAIPSQEYHMNICPVLNGYGETDILNSR